MDLTADGFTRMATLLEHVLWEQTGVTDPADENRQGSLHLSSGKLVGKGEP